jgi:AcrR family transcriptional regulator
MARRTQAQLAQTRQAIIESAKQLFSDKGFARTQVAEIAQNAGVGMSAFYGQFEDKSQLFLFIINEVFSELHAGIVQLRQGVNLNTPFESMIAIQQIYEMVFEALNKHAHIVLSMFRSGFSAIPGLETWYWHICDAVAAELSLNYQQAEAQGLVEIDGYRDMSEVMIGMVQHLGYRMVLQGTPTPMEAARVCTRYTVGSLLMSMPKEKLPQVMPLWAAISV